MRIGIEIPVELGNKEIRQKVKVNFQHGQFVLIFC